MKANTKATVHALAAVAMTTFAALLFIADDPAPGHESADTADERPLDFPSLVTPPRFEEQGNWSDGFKIAKTDGSGVIVGPGTDNKNVFVQRFPASPGREYIVATRAAGVGAGLADGKFQINWLDQSESFLSVSQSVFSVTPREQLFHLRVTAPEKAAHGVLYVVPGNSRDRIRYNEMRVGLAADAEKYFPEPALTRAPRFELTGAWSEGIKLAKQADGSVVVGPGTSNRNAFAQRFSARPGVRYTVVTRAASASQGAGLARVQINWVDGADKFISVSQKVFPVTPTPRFFRYQVTAPEGTAGGTLYVVPGGETHAVRYFEMRVLDKFHFKEDIPSFQVLGIEFRMWAALAAAFFIISAVIRLSALFAQAPAFAAGKQAVFFVLGIAISAASFVALEVPYEMHLDSRWHQAQIDSAMYWNGFSLDLRGSPLYNFGIQMPVNPMLSPTYLLGSLVSADHRIQVQGGFQAAMLFLLFAWVSRKAGARLSDATAIALIGALLMCYPSWSGNALTANAVLGLLWQDASIITFVSAMCFCLIGSQTVNGRWRHLPAIGFSLSVIWFFAAYPELIPFYFLAMLGLSIGCLIASENRSEVFQKCLISSILLIGLLAAGVHRFVLNLFNYTPQMAYGALVPDHMWRWLWLNNTSVLTQPGLFSWKIATVFGLSILGAYIAWRFGNRFARKIVIVALTFEISIYVLSSVNAVVHGFVISFFYVELMGIGVVSMLAASGAWALLSRIGNAGVFSRAPQLQNVFRTLPYVVVILVPLLTIYRDYRDQAIARLSLAVSWPPRTDGAPVSRVVERLKLTPGGEFHGRAVVILGADRKEPATWSTFASTLNEKFRPRIGNDLFNDLAASNVPLANEYGHWTSPSMLALQCLAFCRPEDAVARAAHASRAFTPRLARLMGVSIVVTDVPIPGEREVFNGSSLEDPLEEPFKFPLMVYELDDVNVGQYSPTETVVARGAKEIFDHIQAATFDGRRTAVIEKPVLVSLQPAISSVVRIQKGPELEIDARSGGVSLIVLPFEFSHCLEASGVGLKEIIPVNLAQTGVVIEGRAKVRISYRYGLGKGARCRKMDLERINGLRLKEEAPGRVFRVE